MSKINKTPKINCVIKVAVPFLALFGGQGFASTRNPLSFQSSRKNAQKSIVYVDDGKNKILAINKQQKASNQKSPFAVFTVKNSGVTKSVGINNKSIALVFLKTNDLLASTQSKTAEISGNTQSRKDFTDNWNFSTRFGSPTITNCVAGASYNGVGFTRFVWAGTSGASSFSCTGRSGASVNVGSANTASSTMQLGLNILATCQAIHMACDQEPLPVELLKFEIE